MTLATPKAIALRVHHACDVAEHVTAITFKPVKLGLGGIRLEGQRCTGKPLHLVHLTWYGYLPCGCYRIDDPGWRTERCEHGNWPQAVGVPLDLVDLHVIATESIPVGVTCAEPTQPDLFEAS